MDVQNAKDLYHMARFFSSWYSSTPCYSVEKVARLLKVKPETVASYIVSGKLNAEKLGNTYKIPLEDLLDFLEIQIRGLELRRERRCQSAG